MTKERKETILELLEQFKNKPFLWDKKNKNYTNNKRRSEGYRELLEIYKQYDRNATVTTLRKRISNLRTSFVTELKKVKKTNGVYEPTLWYFDAFKFLESYYDTHYSTRDPLETEARSPSSSNTEVIFQITSEPSSPSQEKKPNYQRISETFRPSQEKKIKISNENLLQTSNDIMYVNGAENYLQIKEEEWQIFGKSIGLQLRDLDKKQLTITQKMISDTIYYAKMDLLSENSFVALGHSSKHTLPYASPCVKDHRQACSCHKPFPKHQSQATRSVSPSSP